MRYRVLTGAVFAIMMFLIPLLALYYDTTPVQFLPVGNSSSQATSIAPASPQEEPPPPEVSDTPAVQVADDGFRILDEQTGKVFTVSAQNYVRGALAAELPPTFHPEALKAQAVAAHTYALNLKAQRRAAEPPDPTLQGADFTADPQNWKSYTTEAVFRERYGALADAYWKSICEAADEVLPYVVVYEDAPIVAAYHSMSSGMTEDAANVWTGGKPYLVPVESKGDPLAPDYDTEQVVSVKQAEDALRTAYPKIILGDDPAQWMHINARSEGGYVTELSVGDRIVHGKELRSLFDLRSSDFDIRCDGAQFVFAVRGYGHGVGLSQYGADYMARQGATFDEILLHYYQGASLAVVSEKKDNKK